MESVEGAVGVVAGIEWSSWLEQAEAGRNWVLSGGALELLDKRFDTSASSGGCSR